MLGRRRLDRRRHRAPCTGGVRRRTGVVLGGARPPRAAAAARHRVGRARPRRPVARQGPRPVGRARLRRPDGAVDGRQRDVRRRPRRPGRRARPGSRRRRAPWRATSSGTPRRRRRPLAATATSRRASSTAWSSWPGGPLHLAEVPARRWHRWGAALTPLALPDAYAHTGLRAPFAFPDGDRRRLGADAGRMAARAQARRRCRRLRSAATPARDEPAQPAHPRGRERRPARVRR